jgi:hypothetical protein
MPAVIPQHEIFNGGSSKDFPNDYTSKNEIERQTRIAEKLKAEKDAAERDAAELITLRALKISLESKVSRAEQAEKMLRESTASLESKVSSLQGEIRNQLLEPKNNLDPAYHGRHAHIYSLESHHFTVDLGGREFVSLLLDCPLLLYVIELTKIAQMLTAGH